MASRGQPITLTYTAWDTATNQPKPNDHANHTLRYIKDGVAAAPTNSPTQVDATNAPGEYNVLLTSAEATAWLGKIAGKSSTANVVILPASVAFENLPTASPGAVDGLPKYKASTVGGTVILENVACHPAAFDNVPITAPTGPPANLRELIVMTFRRFFAKHVKNNSAKTITHYANDGTTAIVSQSYLDDGNGNETVNAAT